MKPSKVIESISSQGIKWVRLQFLDIDGRIRETTVSSNNILSSTFEDGLEVPSLSSFFEENVLLKPIPESFAIVPWEDSTARMLCYVYRKKDPHPKDSLAFLNKVLSLYSLEGFSKVLIQPSCEFTIFETVTMDKVNLERGPSVNLDGREVPWNSNPISYDRKWSNLTMPQDVYSLVRLQILDTLFSFFKITSFENSHSNSTSKQSIVFNFMNAFDACSSIISLKYVARNVSLLNGALATFMPYPIFKSPPNRMRFRVKLFKKDNNELFSPDEGLSDVAKRFIGGIISNAPYISLFTNPTTNSYKGLVAFTLHNAYSSSLNNVVVKFSAKDENNTYVEISLPDSSANPFLALSALLLAGLDGIKSKGKTFDELKQDPDFLSEKERKACLGPSLPFSLYEAIIAYENNNKFLRKVISSEFISDYLSLKLREFKEELSRPSSYDYQEYFNI